MGMKEREKERLCERLEIEAGKILDKAERSELTTGGLDSLLKIVDIMNKLENEKYWDKKCEYYDAILDEMHGGGYSERGYSDDGGNYSERRDSRGDRHIMPDYGRESSYTNRGKHYVRGHYSRRDVRDPYDDYMDGKQSYRNSGKSEDCKKRMLAALEDHMEMLTQEIGDMSKDSECREERETIKRYVDKLRDMM